MNLQRQKAFIIRFIYIAVILGLAYVSLKYVVPLLMPFVIAMIVASILRPVIDKIDSRTPIKRSLISVVILILFYAILILIIDIFGVKIFAFLSDLFSKLPKLYVNTVVPATDIMVRKLLIRFPDLERYLENTFSSIQESLSSFVTSASSAVVGTITGFAGRVPSILINLIFTIASSFFFTIDYHRISGFILKQFSEEKRKMLINLKNNGIGTLGKFAKAYAALITITFSELFVGFLILRIPNAFLLAVVVSVVDILPILGTGAVLIPWTIIAFIFHKNSLALGLFILYCVITVVRQMLEPKIVGQQIGLHPVVTLICMYVGTQLLGIIGLFLLPITVTILKKMDDEGTINILKK